MRNHKEGYTGRNQEEQGLYQKRVNNWKQRLLDLNKNSSKYDFVEDSSSHFPPRLILEVKNKNCIDKIRTSFISGNQPNLIRYGVSCCVMKIMRCALDEIVKLGSFKWHTHLERYIPNSLSKELNENINNTFYFPNLMLLTRT